MNADSYMDDEIGVPEPGRTVQSQTVDPSRLNLSRLSQCKPLDFGVSSLGTCAEAHSSKFPDHYQAPASVPAAGSDISRGSQNSLQEATLIGLRAAFPAPKAVRATTPRQEAPRAPATRRTTLKESGDGARVRVGDVLKHKTHGFLCEVKEVRQDGIVLESSGVGETFVGGRESKNYRLYARGV